MAPSNPDVPVPLTRWIQGRVRVHFRSGHVADLKVSLHGAHSIRLQVDEAQGEESIDGLNSHKGWITAKAEEIVLTEWSPAPDYGWRDSSPDDRERMRRLGMKHGILGAPADLWADRPGSPAYSLNAVSALFGLATKHVVSREEWDRIAELIEGEDGAALVRTVLNEVSPRVVSDESIDDDAEPDPAPDDPRRESADDHGAENHGPNGRNGGEDGEQGGR